MIYIHNFIILNNTLKIIYFKYSLISRQNIFKKLNDIFFKYPFYIKYIYNVPEIDR